MERHGNETTKVGICVEASETRHGKDTVRFTWYFCGGIKSVIPGFLDLVVRSGFCEVHRMFGL